MACDAKTDLFAALDAAPDGYNNLRSAVVDGRLDGTYSTVTNAPVRGCVKAYLAQAYGCPPNEMPGASKVGGTRCSPIEAYVYPVRRGDYVENSAILRHVLAWLDEWKENCDGVDF